MNNGHNYQQEWQKYRVLRARLYIVTIPMTILFGITLAIMVLSLGLIERKILIWTIVSLTLAALVSLHSILRLQRWKCPGCGEAFHGRQVVPNLFESTCRNCGLRRYDGSTFDPAR